MADESEEEKARYKRVRNRAWFIFTAGWFVGWYPHLASIRAAEIARGDACRAAGGWFCGSVDSAAILFAFGIAAVIITCPFTLIPARYAARWWIARATAREARREIRDREAMARRQQEESRKRLAHSEAEAAAVREKNSRTEIMLKFGSINDLVDVMAVEKDQERLMNIRLGVAQALRDLAAKYDMTALGALIQADDAIRITVRAVIERLERTSLSDLVELELLKTATGRGRTT